jgi:dihydroorotate dehydrogenase subfamily 1
MVKIKDSLLNAKFWTDLPIEKWIRHEFVKAKKTGLPLIASIGYTAEEIREIAPKVEEAGADALELCMHHLENEPSLLDDVTKTAKEVVDIPVFVKLNPNVPDIARFARVAERAGADGLVTINSLGPCLAIDIENAMPMLGSSRGYGWLSGPAIKSFALRCVADVCRAVKIPVIGTGGISSGHDVIEFLMVGASMVQVSTAAIVHGPKVYGLMADEMIKFMRARGYDSIADLRGIALRHLPEQPLRVTAKPPEVLISKCNSCGLCEQYCPYEAIRIVRKVARIDSVKCYGCGLCVSVCPTRAIRF